MTTDQSRLAVGTLAPHISKAMNALDAAARETSLEAPLLELVRLRASQLNGCAYCVDLHSRDAREGGETERRLYALPAWRETPFFTDRERAALDLIESLTLIAERNVADDVWERAAAQFDETELPGLVFAGALICGWNRIAISTRMPLGDYVA